jgi:outer membrane protein OmpA-like peptidoglycan-associated protein
MRQQLLLGAFSIAALVGCTTSSSKLATIQAEKEQLLTTIRSQRDTARALNEKLASVEGRLDQAEKELARSGGTGTRLSSVPARPNESSASASSSGSLPWRSPAANNDTQPSPDKNSPRSGSTSSPAKSRGSLVALAKRDNRVRYDSTARAAEIHAPVQFDDKSATISAAGKRQLDEVAKLLRTDEARDLPIVVAAPDAARAKAVADYLDSHGIPEDRLAVSTAARRGAAPNSTTTGGVQVFVLDSEAAVADWGTKTGLRR